MTRFFHPDMNPVLMVALRPGQRKLHLDHSTAMSKMSGVSIRSIIIVLSRSSA